MSAYLDKEALYLLTGKKRPSAVARVLVERKIPFTPGAKGPCVRSDWDSVARGSPQMTKTYLRGREVRQVKPLGRKKG